MLTSGVTTGLAIVDAKPAGTEDQLYVYVPDPPLAAASSCTSDPAQTLPGVAVGLALSAPPVTLTVTASDAEHPVAVIVAVKVKVVVDVRLTVTGSTTVAFTSNEAGVQLYVNGPVPVTVALSVVLVPFGMLASVPALTPGLGFTVTTVAVEGGLWHPDALVILTV